MAIKSIQPEDLFSHLKLNVDEPERVINSLLSLLHYLPPGEIIETNTFRFNKIDPNTIYIESSVDKDDLVNMLSNTSIKLPI